MSPEEEREREKERARLDRFAAAALVGLLSHGGPVSRGCESGLAIQAWTMARAMVEMGPGK